MYYSRHELILDRDGDPTVELDCAWKYHEGEAGSLAVPATWELDSVEARDKDSGRRVDLDDAEMEMVRRMFQPISMEEIIA